MNWGNMILGSLGGGAAAGLLGGGAGETGLDLFKKAIIPGALMGGLAGSSGASPITSGVAGMGMAGLLPGLMKQQQQQPAMQPPGGAQFAMPAVSAQYGAGSPSYQNALAQALAQYQG
jgi:hypothetical protein